MLIGGFEEAGLSGHASTLDFAFGKLVRLRDPPGDYLRMSTGGAKATACEEEFREAHFEVALPQLLPANELGRGSLKKYRQHRIERTSATD